jgi:Na+-translocating ferredoxin:NAD+ oxidoreductase RnfD subunit
MHMVSRLFVLFSQVKMQMVLFLLLISLTAVFHEYFPFSAFYVLLAVISTVFTDWVFIRARKIKSFLLSAAIVTGFIIGLLYSPTLPWYGVVFTSVIAMAAKNFIRYKNRHIFNPAAFGLFFTAIIFQETVSWWGASFQAFGVGILPILLFIILLSPGFVSMIYMKRYRIALSFFAVYILFFGVGNNALGMDLVLGTLLDPTTLFFALVMLPEPMTTPNKPMRQILFGASVGLIVVGLGFIPLSFLPDAFIAALLLGNLLFFRFR